MTLRTILSLPRRIRLHTLSEGCRAHSPATNTRPSLVTSAEDRGISCAVSQSGKYSHVQVTIIHPKTRAVLSFDDERAMVPSTAREINRPATGQKAPALLSQTLPLQRKYWAMPAPKMHGTTPNMIAVIRPLREVSTVFICRSFQESERKEPD